jgi:hypothetical protein
LLSLDEDAALGQPLELQPGVLTLLDVISRSIASQTARARSGPSAAVKTAHNLQVGRMVRQLRGRWCGQRGVGRGQERLAGDADPCIRVLLPGIQYLGGIAELNKEPRPPWCRRGVPPNSGGMPP